MLFVYSFSLTGQAQNPRIHTPAAPPRETTPLLKDHTTLGASEDNPGILRKAAGEMNAEFSFVLLEGAMNFLPIPARSHHSPRAQTSGAIELVVRN